MSDKKEKKDKEIIKKESTKSPKKDFKLEVDNLKKENGELIKSLIEKQTQIDNLKMEIEKINLDYKDQITKKMDQANKLIHEKQEENNNKFKSELEYAKKYAIEDKAVDLINIITQFELALNFTPNNPEILNYQKGFKMFYTMLDNLLKDFNIVQIKPEIGKEFDSNLMECFETSTNDKFNDNEITEILNIGYKLYDHILKPALVKVNKKN